MTDTATISNDIKSLTLIGVCSMTKVYLVNFVKHPLYIQKIFSTKEKAEDFCSKLDISQKAIVEIDLDNEEM